MSILWGQSSSALEERVAALERRMDEMNRRTIGSVRMGPLPEPSREEILRNVDKIVKEIGSVPPLPTDWDARSLQDGRPVTEDHREINPVTGQQKDYVVLTAEERAKGFVRPVRTEYRHLKCGTLTSM